MDTLVLHAGDEYTGSLWDAVYTKEGVQVAPYYLEQLGVQAFVSGSHDVGRACGGQGPRGAAVLLLGKAGWRGSGKANLAALVT